MALIACRDIFPFFPDINAVFIFVVTHLAADGVTIRMGGVGKMDRSLAIRPVSIVLYQHLVRRLGIRQG
jgi:hypothetical protein